MLKNGALFTKRFQEAKLIMFRRVNLPAGIKGQLFLHSTPGRYEDWSTFLNWAHQCDLKLVVCLPPRSELEVKSPSYARALAEGTLPSQVLELKMPDFGLPTDMRAFVDGILRAAREVCEGHHVLIHCGAGIGRTGTAAACILQELGLSSKQALMAVRQAGSSPETSAQKNLVASFLRHKSAMARGT